MFIDIVFEGAAEGTLAEFYQQQKVPGAAPKFRRESSRHDRKWPKPGAC